MSAKTPAETPDAKPLGERGEAIVSRFCSLGFELAGAILEMFPECIKTKKAYAYFDATRGDSETEEEIIRAWHKGMYEHYDPLEKGDFSTLESLTEGAAFDMGIVDKLRDPSFDAESRAALHEYLRQLNILSNCYCTVPRSVMVRIASMQTEMAQALSCGPPSQQVLHDLGVKIMESVPHDECDEFLTHLPGLMNIARLMQGEGGPAAAPAAF
jgi:hypothetical protein